MNTIDLIGIELGQRLNNERIRLVYVNARFVVYIW